MINMEKMMNLRLLIRSDDEVLELRAVSNGLSSQNVSEDGDHDVINVVRGILDNGVSKEEFNSDILEAVGGKEEGNTVPFNNVSDLDGGLVLVAFVKHFLSFFHKSDDFDEEVHVVLLNNF